MSTNSNFKGGTRNGGRSYTRKFGGPGIGLTLARRIMELCGGRIWVESPPGEALALEAGRGSSFIFEIPCVPKQQNGKIDETKGKNYKSQIANYK